MRNRIITSLKDQGQSFLVVLFQLLEECARVVRRVVLHDFRGELVVDLVDVLAQLGARRSLDFLDLLETATLQEGSFILQVLRQGLGKLLHDIFKNIRRRHLQERL